MKNAPVVVEDPFEVEARLNELGLSSDDIREPAGAGLSARASCSDNDPPWFPGLLQFAIMVRTLRERKAPDGWSRNDYKNFSTVVRSDGLVAIAIARGDDGTGNRDAVVSTKYPKGVATLEAVNQNLRLPFDEQDIAQNQGKASTWFLLHSRTKDELELELSHPTLINDHGYITKWDVRLILKPLSLNPERMPVDEDEPVEPVVTVKKRGKN